MKKITICEKEYSVDCNAFTRFQYKKVFGTGIFSDIKILNNFSDRQNDIRKKLEKENASEDEIQKAINDEMLDNLDDFIDVIENKAIVIYEFQ